MKTHEGKRVRTIDLSLAYERSKRADPRACEHNGCHNSTREGKPFCKDHLFMAPYIQKLVKEIEKSHQEELRVRQRGIRAVEPDMLVAKEILLHLSQRGPRTIKRLAKDLQIRPDVIRLYIRGLAKADKVTFGRTARGNITVRIAS